MSGGRWFRYLATVSAVAGLVACGDYTGSTSPPEKKMTPTSPVGASFSRYILISGAWTCVEDCEEGDDGGDRQLKLQSLPTSPDSSLVDSIPALFDAP